MTALTREQELDAITVVLKNRQSEDTDEQVAERVIDALSMAQPKYQRAAPDHPGGRRGATVNVDTEPVRREVMRVVKRWDMGPEAAAAVIDAVSRGLAASQGDEGRDLRALVEHEQAEMEQWLDVITDPPCRHDRSSSAQHKADNLVTYGCPGYDPIAGAELAVWLRKVRDEMRQWERPEVKRGRALAAEEERA